MLSHHHLPYLFLFLIFQQCNNPESAFDASGAFEATEVIVSSEVTGTILQFDAREGDRLAKGALILQIDPLGLAYQKSQIESTIASLKDRQVEANPQIRIIEELVKTEKTRLSSNQDRLQYLENEKTRIENLIAADAAVTKDLDLLIHQISQQKKVIESNNQQIQVLEQQIKSHARTIQLQNRAINSEEKPLSQQVALIQDQLNRAEVKNPLTGSLLTKYVQAGEFVTPGKALYKIADLEEMNLRAYITGDQLSSVSVGQKVHVYVDKDEASYLEYEGVINWISSKAEFTPKTIQTKNERADLVYAIKVSVVNDGLLKIGMYGEIKFGNSTQPM